MLGKIGVGKIGARKNTEKKDGKTGEKLEDSEVGKVISFSAEGESHKLWIAKKGNKVEVMVASTPMSVGDKLKEWRGKIDNLPEEKRERAETILDQAKALYSETHEEAKETDKAVDKANKPNASSDEVKKAQTLDNEVENKEEQLSDIVQQLFNIFGEINWSVDENTKLTKTEIDKLRSLEGGNTLIVKIEHQMKTDPKEGISTIKEVRVMMSLSDDIIFVGGAIHKETKKVFFRVGNEPVRVSEHGEIDILTNKEYIEVKTGNFVNNLNGFSGGDIKKMEKYKDYVNGKPKIFDKTGNLIDLSNKILVLQIDQNEIAPMILAQMRKISSPYIIRFANGSEIKISEVPFEGKYRKPTNFKGMNLIKSLQEYLNIK